MCGGLHKIHNFLFVLGVMCALFVYGCFNDRREVPVAELSQASHHYDISCMISAQFEESA